MALEGYPLGRRERSRASGEKPPMVGRFVPVEATRRPQVSVPGQRTKRREGEGGWVSCKFAKAKSKKAPKPSVFP